MNGQFNLICEWFVLYMVCAFHIDGKTIDGGKLNTMKTDTILWIRMSAFLNKKRRKKEKKVQIIINNLTLL